MKLPKPIRKLFSKSIVSNLLIAFNAMLTPGGQSHDLSISIVSPSGYHVSVSYSASKG